MCLFFLCELEAGTAPGPQRLGGLKSFYVRNALQTLAYSECVWMLVLVSVSAGVAIYHHLVETKVMALQKYLNLSYVCIENAFS